MLLPLVLAARNVEELDELNDDGELQGAGFECLGRERVQSGGEGFGKAEEGGGVVEARDAMERGRSLTNVGIRMRG